MKNHSLCFDTDIALFMNHCECGHPKPYHDRIECMVPGCPCWFKPESRAVWVDRPKWGNQTRTHHVDPAEIEEVNEFHDFEYWHALP